MATTLDFSELRDWLFNQPVNTASTPYEIIITNAPASGYSNALNPPERFVSIVGMEMSPGVTSMGDYAFNNCTVLTSINIPEGVTSIVMGAFSSCTGLTSINIPESATTIGGDAFSGCTGLTSITIPESVTSIGNYVFQNCSGLTSVFMKPSFSESLMQSHSFYGTPESLKLYVPSSKISSWQSATLSNYGFATDVKAETFTKKWIRIA